MWDRQGGFGLYIASVMRPTPRTGSALALVDVIATLAIHASVSGETSRAFMEKVVSEPLTAPLLALLGTTAYFALREGREQNTAAAALGSHN